MPGTTGEHTGGAQSPDPEAQACLGGDLKAQINRGHCEDRSRDQHHEPGYQQALEYGWDERYKRGVMRWKQVMAALGAKSRT